MIKEIGAVSRREFLTLTGKSATVSAGMILAGCAQSSTQPAGRSAGNQARAIDIHHHYFPPELIKEVKQHSKALGIENLPSKGSAFSLSFGKGNRTGVDLEIMDVDKRLEMMSEGKLAIAAIEAQPSAQGYLLDGKHGETWSRLYNDGMHSLAKRYPQRFIGMATVPLQDPARAASVLEHAVSELKLSGVTIGSNVNGKYFDGKEFDPFWKKAEELDVLIIMHPDSILGSDQMGAYGLRTVCGNPADTTLSVGFMVYSGVFDRFPKLKLGLLHGGGFFPYHLGRFDQGFKRSSGRQPFPASQPPSRYLKNLYFDNLVYRVETVEYLKRMVGADHIMVGTDYPYTLGDWMAVEKIEQMNCTEAEREAMLHGNARKLLKITAT
jgi:aminocarboxymuconate-semialdehyde decarboxylase